MKSMFDNYFGGRITSRQAMQDKIRNMTVTETVQGETAKVIAARTPAEVIESSVEYRQQRRWTLFKQEKSAPYVGERY
jgi:hypothetical protein